MNVDRVEMNRAEIFLFLFWQHFFLLDLRSVLSLRREKEDILMHDSVSWQSPFSLFSWTQ